VLRHAVTTVEFYKNIIPYSEFLQLDKNPLLAYEKIPYLSKQQVSESNGKLLSNKKGKMVFKGGTSGTTGTPLTLFQDLKSINIESAFIERQLHWAGYEHGDRQAWIRGDMIVPIGVKDPPFWRKNSVDNMMMYSSYHLSEENMPAYIESLSDFDPVIIQAYPSSISIIAQYLKSHGLKYRGKSLKGVVTSSESLTTDQRDIITKVFQCKVFDWYGQFERVAAIGTCTMGNYHIMSDYSYTELVSVGGSMYEIVGTSYNNTVMPLIKYRTGDYVNIRNLNAQCNCGLSFPVIDKIHGRNDDYVMSFDGVKIGRLDHIFKGAKGVLEAQIVQNKKRCIEINIVAGSDFNNTSIQLIEKNVADRLGEKMNIKFNLLDNIPRTQNGKFRAVICNLKNNVKD